MLQDVFAQSPTPCTDYDFTETVFNYSRSQLSSPQLVTCDSYILKYDLSFVTPNPPALSTITIHLPFGISYESLITASSPGISSTSNSGNLSPTFILNAGATHIEIFVNTPSSVIVPTQNTTDIEFENINNVNCIASKTPSFILVTNDAFHNLSVNIVSGAPYAMNTGELRDWVIHLYNNSDHDISALKIDLSDLQYVVDITGYKLDQNSTEIVGCSGGTSGNNITISLDKNSGWFLHVCITPKCPPTNESEQGGKVHFGSICNKDDYSTELQSNLYVYREGLPEMKITSVLSDPFTLTNTPACSTSTPPLIYNNKVTVTYENVGTPITQGGVGPAVAKLIDLCILVSIDDRVGTIDASTFDLEDMNSNHASLNAALDPVLASVYSHNGYTVYAINFTKLTGSAYSSPFSTFSNTTLCDLDGDGQFDDLTAGGGVKLNFIVTNNPSCPFNEGSSEIIAFINTYPYFQNQCKNLTCYSTGTNISKYAYNPIDGPGYFFPDNSPNEKTNKFSPDKTYTSASFAYATRDNNTSTAFVKPDVQTNETFPLTICPKFSQEWIPLGFNFNCPNPIHRIRLDLHQGYKLDLTSLYNVVGTSGFMNITQHYSTAPIPIKLTEVQVGCSSYVNIDISPAIPTYSLSLNRGIGTDYFDCITIPLMLNCSCAVTNSSPHPFSDQFDYEVQYICCPESNPQADNCTSFLTKANTNTTHHCFGRCALYSSNFQSFNNTDGFAEFIFRRKTLGWLNPDPQSSSSPLSYNSNSILSSSAIHVNPTNNLIKLDRGYPGDIVEVKMDGYFGGKFSDFSSVFLQFEYTDLGSGAKESQIFNLDPKDKGTITVYPLDISKNPIPGAEIVFNLTNSDISFLGPNGDNIDKMRFVINPSAYGNPVLNQSYGYILKADINLIIKTAKTLAIPPPPGIIPRFFTPGRHHIDNFRSGFAGINISQNILETSCDDWGAEFTILQPKVDIGLTAGGNSTCDDYKVVLTLHGEGGMRTFEEPDFPYEFRPYIDFNSPITLNFPPEYKLKAATFSMPLTSYSNITPFIGAPPVFNNYFPDNFTSFCPPVNLNLSSVLPATNNQVTINPTFLLNGPNFWPLMDQKMLAANHSGLDFDFYFEPLCGANDINPGGFNASIGYTECFQNQDLVNTLFPDYQTNYSYSSNLSSENTGTVHKLDPDLHLQITNGITSISSPSFISEQFKICNNSYDPSTYININAPYLQLKLAEIGQVAPTAKLVEYQCDHNPPLPLSVIYNQFPIGSGIFDITNPILENTCVCFRLEGDITGPSCSIPPLTNLSITPQLFYKCPADNYLNWCTPISPNAISGSLQFDFSSFIWPPPTPLAINAFIEPLANPMVTTKTLCHGESVTLKATGGTSYQWHEVIGGIDNVISGATTNSLTVTPSITTIYYAIGTTGSCAGTSGNITISVEAPPNPPTLTGVLNYCFGDVATLYDLTNLVSFNPSGATNLQLQWYNSATSGTPTPTPQPASTLTPNTIQHYYVSQFNLITGCEGPRSKLTVYVGDSPTMNQIGNIDLCNGNQSNVVQFSTSSSNSLNYEYSWTNSNASIGLASNGLGELPSFLPIATTSNVQSFITVTPLVTGMCPGVPISFMISANPTPTLDPISDYQYCPGNLTTPIHLTSGSLSNLTTFIWSNTNPLIGLPSNGNGDIPAFYASDLSGSGITPGVSLITVTPQINSCAGSPLTFQINAISPIIGITASANNVCPNELVHLIPEGAITYTISYTDPFGVIQTQSGSGTFNVHPSVTTTYTVTGTDINGCTGSTTITINVINHFTILGPTNNCKDNSPSVYTISPSIPNTTYTWKFTDIDIGGNISLNTITTTTNTINHSWGYYGGSVIVSLTGPCILSPCTLTVAPCCLEDISYIKIPNHTTLTDAFTQIPNFNTSSMTFSVEGEFIINQLPAPIFSKCHFVMAPGAEIVVEHNIDFNAEDCIFEGCPDMWNGILLKNNARIYIESSIVKDALTAISCSSTSEFNVSNCLFNKNRTGILVNGTGTISAYVGYVSGSVFTCRKGIDIPPSISSLVSDLRSTNNSINLNHYLKDNLGIYLGSNMGNRAGVAIDIINVGANTTSNLANLTIGDATSNYSTKGNLFDNHDYGIRAENSNIKIVNNLFQEMSGNDIKGSPGTGIGIWARNTKTPDAYCIQVGGIYSNENNTITDCGIGVLINDYTYVTALSNTISKTVGLGSPFGSYNYVGRFGIKLTNSLESYYSCNNNHITNMHYGIDWAQNSEELLHCNFNLNTITTNSTNEICHTAIYLHGPILYDITSSTIEINSNTISNVWNGIKVYNFLATQYISIQQNADILIRRSVFPQYGIFLFNCHSPIILNNSNIHAGGSDNTNVTGVYLCNSELATIDCNTIYDIGNCVGLSRDCSTNPYYDAILHKNKFRNYKTGVDIEAISTVDDQGSHSLASDNEWTHSSGSFDVFNHSSNNIQFFARNTTPTFTPGSTSISGLVTFPFGNQNITPCIAQTPFSPTTNLSPDELIFIRKLAEGNIIFPVLAPENKWLYGNVAYEKIMGDSTINPNDSIIGNFIDSLNNTTNLGKFYSVGNAISSKNWVQAEIENQSINIQNHIEDNLKKFNQYYIAFNNNSQLYGDEIWKAAMISDLSPIAYECYSTGGPAVLSSRTMLSYFTNNIYSENEGCLQAPANEIAAEISNNPCDLIKNYSVSATTGATYTWTVPSGTSFTQSGNSISVNWGSVIGTGGTITCTIMDALGNTSTGSYTQAPLVSNPTCITASANNTSCVTATQLSWNPPAGCAAGYLIMLGTNGAGTTTPDNVVNGWDVGNVTSVTLPMLSGGTTYYYQVIPYDDAHVPVNGCSIFSFTSGTAVDFTPTLGNPYIENFDGVSPPELPCGITISDENFPRDGVVWATSTAASCSGNNSIAISKNPNNTTAKDDWFYSAPLNLTGGELYQVDFNAKTDGPQTEGIEAYIGSSPDAATMQSNSSIINSYISNSTCVNTLASDYIASYTGQYFVGVHANGSPNSQTLFVDDLRVSLIPTVKISAESCGDTLSSCERIQCDLINGATSYKFRIENLQLGFSMDYTVNSNNPLLSEFYNAPVLPLPLGETYTVSVTAFVNGNWMPFGASCTITINAQTSVTASDVSGCTGSAISLYGSPSGGTFSLSNPYTGPSASYTYTFTDEYGCAVTSIPANITVNALPTVSAANVSGCEGTAISLSGSPAGGTWSVANPYTGASTTYTHSYTDANGCSNTSASATITVTACPKLNTTTCNTASFNMCDRLAITTVSGATAYKYKFENTSLGFSQEYTPASLSYNPYMYQFLNATSTSIIPGYTYAVSVAALVNGSWTYYGPACNVVVNPIPITSLNSASCNINLPSMNTYFYTNNTGICGIYDYKYEFTEGNTTFEVNRGLTLNNYIMIWIPSPNQAKYSTTYSVRVKLKMGNTWGNYGPSCTITTPPSPLTQLQTAYCGYTLPLFSSLVNCDAVPGAIDYRYHITGPSNYNKTFNRNQAGNDWHFSWTILGGGQQNMVPNTTYAVEVASNAGGVWSAYGASCNITTPATQWREAEAFELNQNSPLNEATDELALLVYPNPNAINNEFFIEVRGIHTAGEAAQITIFDLVGKLIYKETATYNEGDTQLRVKPGVRPAQGVYLIEAIVKGKKLRQKFVVD